MDSKVVKSRQCSPKRSQAVSIDLNSGFWSFPTANYKRMYKLNDWNPQ